MAEPTQNPEALIDPYLWASAHDQDAVDAVVNEVMPPGATEREDFHKELDLLDYVPPKVARAVVEAHFGGADRLAEFERKLAAAGTREGQIELVRSLGNVLQVAGLFDIADRRNREEEEN